MGIVAYFGRVVLAGCMLALWTIDSERARELHVQHDAAIFDLTALGGMRIRLWRCERRCFRHGAG